MIKWTKILILIVGLAFLFSGCALFRGDTLAKKNAAKITAVAPTQAQTKQAKVEADVQETGKYTLGDAPVGKGTFYITVEVPLLQDIKNPNWQLSASWAWYNGNKWILVPLDKYSVKTELKDGALIGHIPVPTGVELYWPRIWGQELESKEWLSPDEGNVFARGNIKGHLAYEFLVNTKTGEKSVVPGDYQKRP